MARPAKRTASASGRRRRAVAGGARAIGVLDALDGAVAIAGLARSRSGSVEVARPGPRHSGHQPWGELNEKSRGSSLPRRLQQGQLGGRRGADDCRR